MNLCEERHIPKYVIKYMGSKGSKYTPTWHVCEMCMQKECFGKKTDILDMMMLQ